MSGPQSSEPINTAQTAFTVVRFNKSIKDWVERLGLIWVEGQLSQINIRPSWSLAYLTLRDLNQEVSVSLTAPRRLVDGSSGAPALSDGARVVILGKPKFYEGRGSFSLEVREIHQVGLGELLARIAQLRARLAQEGLFDPQRKRPLPFVPNVVGLITGRASAAERDVISVAQQRWPAVKFRVINTAVQGPRTVPEVISALQTLDADPEVDVIIIARGGGSVEDLLPFSEESLQYAVAAARTPVVSAIGHEPDNPILDNVADLRASTPTDAAKKVVPDAAAERIALSNARERMAGALRRWVQREQAAVTALRSRPVLSQPLRLIDSRRELIHGHQRHMRLIIDSLVAREGAAVAALRAQIRTLGPAATLARGYAVVQVVPTDGSAPEVVMGISQVRPGSQLRVRVGDGSISAAALAITPAD